MEQSQQRPNSRAKSNPAFRPKDVVFGFPVEWERFARKHKQFISEFNTLNKSFKLVFGRVAQTRTARDRIVFHLGSLCVEEFKEILLLCGNAYGIGGAKLLRSLYERTVTCAYLVAEPTAFMDFMNYYHVQRFRELNHIRSVKGIQHRFSSDEMMDIEQKYSRVKQHFQETLCGKCDIKRPQPSWTKLSLPAMAHKVGPAYEKLYFSCYFQPTLQAHSTVSSVTARLTSRSDGGTDFYGGPQRRVSSRVMGFAHCLILLLLSSQNTYFGLGIEQRLKDHAKNWNRIWGREIYPSKRKRLDLL